MKLLVSILLTTIVNVSATLLLTTCNGTSNTCGPSQCVKVNNTACSAPTSLINVTLAVSNIQCKQCKQSTDSRCSLSSLQAMLTLNAGIKAAYCNDKFLVIHSDDTPNHNDSLADIERPPGGGTGSYATQCVTRGRVTQFNSFKIPLVPVALDTANSSNNLNSFTKYGIPYLTTASLPTSGPAAYTKSGLPIFPPYNDQSVITWRSCEMDRCNAHVGKGFDYHYHGDPFGTSERPCLYSSADYSSVTSHPPLIGWGADGYSLYGRYLSESAPGYTTALDDCGGHTHDTYGYHYHSQVLDYYDSGWNLTAYIAGPFKCWKGNVSTIDGFWDTAGLTVAYGSGIATVLGNLASRSDYEYLKPCCNATQSFSVAGVALQDSSASATSAAAGSTTSTISVATQTQTIVSTQITSANSILSGTSQTITATQLTVSPVSTVTQSPVLTLTQTSASQVLSLTRTSASPVSILTQATSSFTPTLTTQANSSPSPTLTQTTTFPPNITQTTQTTKTLVSTLPISNTTSTQFATPTTNFTISAGFQLYERNSQTIYISTMLTILSAFVHVIA